MISFFLTVTAFAALAVLCLFVARTAKIPAALAPLPVVGGVMVFLVLGGYLGVLKPAASLVLFAALAAVAQMVVSFKKGGFRACFTPGFVLFLVGGVVAIAYFAWRQPMAQGWDEFSLWMTGAKLTNLHDTIYSAAQMGWPWIGTQKPGLPTFSYLFTFGTFAAWRVYAAYAVLYLAVWAALMGRLQWRQWQLCVPTALCAFLLPYFTVYVRDIYVNYLYMDSYADFPMGVFAAGILAWYYWAKNADVHLWPICLGIAALTLYKDTGLALACILAAIIFADLLFCGRGEKLLCAKTIAKKTGLFAAMMASTGGMYMLSSLYISKLYTARAALSAAATVSGTRTEAISPVTMVIEGIKALFGLAPSSVGAAYTEKFAEVKAQMIAAFLPGASSRVTMIGCGLFVMLLIWALLALAAVLTKDKRLRRSAVLYGVFSTIGFVLYYAFIGFTYVYVFKTGVTDYNRYINTYYLLWLGGALALFVQCAYAGSRKKLLVPALLCVSLVFLLRFNQMVQRQLCVIDYPDVVYNANHAAQARAEAVKELLQPEDTVFYVHTADDGRHWFETSYNLLPNILAYSHGGGPLYSLYGAGITAEELAAEIALQGCAYVYLDHTDDAFWDAFGSLFADGGAAAKAGDTILYAVQLTGTPQTSPVTPEMVRNPEKELRADGTVAMSEEGQLDAFERVTLDNMARYFTLVPVNMEVPS